MWQWQIWHEVFINSVLPFVCTSITHSILTQNDTFKGKNACETLENVCENTIEMEQCPPWANFGELLTSQFNFNVLVSKPYTVSIPSWPVDPEWMREKEKMLNNINYNIQYDIGNMQYSYLLDSQ